MPHFCHMCSDSPWYVGTWCAAAPKTQTLSPADCFASPRLHSSAAQRCACWHGLQHLQCSSCFRFLVVVFFGCCCFFLSSWPPLAASWKQERWWKHAIVGKCSFLSGMTQAAAVISTVIVGHHQRASITPARPWHRQQVPALPARLAPTRLWKPSDIQKGTDLLWMHHWINTADYQLTYTVLYRTEKREKWVLKPRKPVLKILAVCCSNHALNADLALFKVGFYKPARLCVGQIQCALAMHAHKCNCSGRICCLMATFVKKSWKMTWQSGCWIATRDISYLNDI